MFRGSGFGLRTPHSGPSGLLPDIFCDIRVNNNGKEEGNYRDYRDSIGLK